MINNLDFYSGKNYMKRDSSSSSAILAAPSTPIYAGLQFITQHTVTHNLGYIPFFTVSGELYNDGVIWEANGSRNTDSTFNPRTGTANGPYLMAYSDTTTLTIEIGYFSNSLGYSVPVYWNIYKDYGIV